MDWKYLFEKTLLPEWALGILVTIVFTIKGGLSLFTGGGMLVALGGIVYLIYLNEVPAVRIPSTIIMLVGVILIITNLF